MMKRPNILWFRNDLRLFDNPALTAAIETDAPLICVYILETQRSDRDLGGARKWWLHKSLIALKASIEARGGQLVLRRGDAANILAELADASMAEHVFWNRRYDQTGRTVDTRIKTQLTDKGLDVSTYSANVLVEPWRLTTGTGSYYKVFTPYWKALQKTYTPPPPLRAPDTLNPFGPVAGDALETWGLHPSSPDWSTGFDADWQPGEDGAHRRLDNFLSGPLSTYQNSRNRPDLSNSTSGLSPHLAFGEISPAHIWRQVQDLIARGQTSHDDAMVFLSEICWRDFAYVLLFHNPNLTQQNYNPTFDLMDWRRSNTDLAKWQTGQTGYPIVDAGMRQLWATGWMHNRVRMIVASFLTKHLLIDWRHGEDWFWDTLLDADIASNSAGWQWTAGSGADAAPYFRVFNPITQGEKFDETGAYVRRWCPELRGLPKKNLHSPWSADAATLKRAGIVLGQTYPRPMIEHKTGRQRALDAYSRMKEIRDAQ